MRGSLAASAFMALAGIALAPNLASAHVAISSGPAVANTNAEVAFGVGHGCEGSDTYTVTVDIPAGVTSVRAVPNEFGKVSVVKDGAGNVTSVTWQKADADLLPRDDNYYKLALRLKVPNAPFTTVYFPVHQTCKTAANVVLPVVDWVATPATPVVDGGPELEPAAALIVLPATKPGWNKLTVPAAVPTASLPTLFANAQVVWKGNAAYSPNPATVDQIKATAGVTELTALVAGDEIWVKY